jgi:DNA polymerase-1
MPKLTNSKGKPVGALQGMINTVLSLHRISPNATHRVCVFDPPGGSQMRKDAFTEYKGKREKLDDDLAVQSKPARKAVKSLGWGVYEVPGVEADDVIATLAERFSHKHRKAKVVIHSGDKDMMQLIDLTGQVTVNNPIKKQVFGLEEAREIWGVDPWLIPQVQALIGDSIDNIPGCKGIGIETAKKLFAEHGNLKGIMKFARSSEKQTATVKRFFKVSNSFNLCISESISY